MIKPLIIANWKCNPKSIEESKILFKEIKENVFNKNVVICPPSIFISSLICEGVIFGAQDCSLKNEGSFTGEISAQMIKSIGCEYVIIGHSERRRIFKEDNQQIKMKIDLALKAKLKPIVCIGEDTENTFDFLKEQIKDIDENIILAYEPIWAIGTGNSASLDKVKEVKEFLGKRKVLYGGSVNSQNFKQYLSVMDGLLIGGASLDSKEFNNILCDINF